MLGPDEAPIPLAPEDRAILTLESPTIAGHTCKVIHLGPNRRPDGAQLRERHRRTDPSGARAHPPTGTGRDGTPGWVPDPDFAVEHHVVEHHHDQPVDAAGLRRCVATLFEQRLERDRPLWRVDVIDCADGQRALVWRIHHALADGTASVRYARALLWDDPPETHMTTAQTARPARRRRDATARAPGRLPAPGMRALDVPSPFDGEICNRREVAFASSAAAPLHEAAKAT